MSVDHGCGNVGVAHELLDRANVVAVFQQVGGKRVPQCMAGDLFVQTGL